jgi:hypothetical protein
MRLLVILVVLAALAGQPASATGAGPTPRPVTGGREELRHALAVLHDWDDRRARAWAESDVSALRSFYVSHSTAARSDVRLLRSYTARGFVVRRIVTQVFGVRVLRSTPDRLVIRVLDRVAGGQVDQGDRLLALPSSRPAVRRIVLARERGAWRVAAVTGWGTAPRGARH